MAAAHPLELPSQSDQFFYDVSTIHVYKIHIDEAACQASNHHFTHLDIVSANSRRWIASPFDTVKSEG